MTDTRKTTDTRAPAEANSDDPRDTPTARPTQPAPPERHPDGKPEDAGGEYEDLEVRDLGNRRPPPD